MLPKAWRVLRKPGAAGLAVPGSHHMLPAAVCPFLGADKFPVTFPTRKERLAAEDIGQMQKTKPRS